MSVSENLKAIQNKIAIVAKKFDRDVATINLVAVSKVQPDEKIVEVLDAGHRLFGENRVQEAQQRWGHRKGVAHLDVSQDLERSQIKFGMQLYEDIKLHLIGPLQTNKVKDAVALFDVIETVDREKLARALSDEMKKQNRALECFIQVNTGDEEQKAGIAISALPAFYDFCARECGLNIIGLMCIPPVDEPPALHFALLKKHADALGLKNLSMGMSADFEKAIPLGATYVRVGTGIFGERSNS